MCVCGCVTSTLLSNYIQVPYLLSAIADDSRCVLSECIHQAPLLSTSRNVATGLPAGELESLRDFHGLFTLLHTFSATKEGRLKPLEGKRR